MPFYFGLGRGKVSRKEEKRIEEAIQRVVDEFWEPVDFVNCHPPGDGWRYWFEGPNRGEPYDRDLARRVMNAVGEVRVMEWDRKGGKG